MRRLTCVASIMCVIAIGAWAASDHGEPVAPIEPRTHDDAKVALGRRLFNDARLSHQGTFACGTCHRLEAGGDDGAARSAGADGRPLDVNTPTVFNAAMNFRLNWRGEFRSIEEQNEAVLLNARIMNTSWDELTARLRADRDYVRDFAALYGGLTPAHVLDALATFQRSLATPNSRFDRHLRGERGVISP